MDSDSIVGATPALRVATSQHSERTVAVEAATEASATQVALVGPTGVTALEPLVMATRSGRTAFYPNCAAEMASRLVARLEDGDLPTDDALAVVEHGPDQARLPLPEGTPLSVGSRRVLARSGWVTPSSVADADHDGLVTATATGADGPDAFDVELLGRGRGDARSDAPITDAWEQARAADGEPVVVVNANESDPNAATDRLLVTGVPIEVLDGALAVAAIVDATDVLVYVSEADRLVDERVVRARDVLVETLDVSPTVEVVAGPDEYRAGEPTMALEAMEGADRIEARRRPPGPAAYGLYGRPTVVHTPRTFVQVRAALSRPGEFEPGVADPGTRLVTVAGDVDAPATVELSTGTSLSTALSAVESDPVRFACVGGQFGGLTRDLDVPVSAPGLRGAGLGTNGVVEVFGPDACAVATAGHRARFAREENCGRCVPCREGSVQLTDLLRDVYDGSYDDDTLQELTRVMRDTSLCQFGRSAARPVTTAIEEFEAEFRAHANGHCPTGNCLEGQS